MSTNDRHSSGGSSDNQQWKDVPIDWEALEDAFENNAPEVHSYLHVPTGDVLRIVDGIADPQMHARIAADANYLRIEPVSSREQYRWMERYIPMVDNSELQGRLTHAIDGKGAFRRFKDVLMSYGPERERWFAFRSERLRIFMEAWLNAHALNPVKRPVWVPDLVEDAASEPGAEVSSPSPVGRPRTAEVLRHQLRDIVDGLSSRELEHLAAFGEFLRTRDAKRHPPPPKETAEDAPEADAPPKDRPTKPSAKAQAEDDGESPSSSRVAKRQAVGGD